MPGPLARLQTLRLLAELSRVQASWRPRVPQISYSDGLYMLRNRTSPTGLMYHHASASAWFDYADVRSGARHQVWFDDWRSVRDKSAWAFGSGMQGVNFWTGDTLYGPDGADNAYARQFWQAAKPPDKTAKLSAANSMQITSFPRPAKTDDQPFPMPLVSATLECCRHRWWVQKRLSA